MPHVTVPEDTFQRLSARAAALNISVNDLVRPALDRLAETGNPTPEQPPLPLAGNRLPVQVGEVVEERIARLDKAATLRGLEELQALPQNWSGSGASPIDPDRIRAAKAFISALPCDLIATPKVVPMTRGWLQFEWHRGNRSPELEFESSERIRYLKWDSDAGIEEEDAIPIDDGAKIHALLRWFAPEPVNV